MNHLAVNLKLIQHCKSTIFQLKKLFVLVRFWRQNLTGLPGSLVWKKDLRLFLVLKVHARFFLELMIVLNDCPPTKNQKLFCQLLQFPKYKSHKIKIKFIIYANILYPMEHV